MPGAERCEAISLDQAFQAMVWPWCLTQATVPTSRASVRSVVSLTSRRSKSRRTERCVGSAGVSSRLLQVGACDRSVGLYVVGVVGRERGDL